MPSRAIVLAAIPAVASALQLPCNVGRPIVTAPRAERPEMGMFDNLFKESEADKRRKDEQLAAMKEMQDRRRDPVASTQDANKRRTAEQAMQAAKVGNLPTGWSSDVDPSTGDRYFWKTENENETSWDPPQEMITEMIGMLEEMQKEEMEAAIKRVNEGA